MTFLTTKTFGRAVLAIAAFAGVLAAVPASAHDYDGYRYRDRDRYEHRWHREARAEHFYRWHHREWRRY